MKMFVWITENEFNLLNADQHGLPHEGWKQNANNRLSHPNGHSATVAAEQPEDPYLLAAN